MLVQTQAEYGAIGMAYIKYHITTRQPLLASWFPMIVCCNLRKQEPFGGEADVTTHFS